MEEAKLREKLARIEALFAGATTEGEKVAAAEARRRIQLRLQAIVERDPPVEYRLTVADVWSGKVLLALLRRYDLKPYRYRNQRRTTIMVKAPASFINDTLWPEFQGTSRRLLKLKVAVPSPPIGGSGSSWKETADGKEWQEEAGDPRGRCADGAANAAGRGDVRRAA
jgi:hypothetical protein